MVDTQNSKAIIDTLVTPLSAQAGKGRFAVLINNLGGVSALEMALLTKELAHSALKESIAYLIGPAPLVSALDMKGFSLTLLKLNDFFEKRFTPTSRRWDGRSPSRLRHCAPWRIAPFMTVWSTLRLTIHRCVRLSPPCRQR